MARLHLVGIAFSRPSVNLALAILDCVHRTTFLAKWLLMSDVDEYLHVVPPHSLTSLLARHQRYAWLSVGAILWNKDFCLPRTANLTYAQRVGERRNFAIGRIRYRQREPYCENREHYPNPNLCLSYEGHRKLILNPRQIALPGTHRVMHSHRAGADLDAATEARYHHFRSLGAVWQGSRICNRAFSEAEAAAEGLVRDTTLAKVAAKVRKCPLGSPQDCFSKLLTRKESLHQTGVATARGSSFSPVLKSKLRRPPSGKRQSKLQRNHKPRALSRQISKVHT
eukprot:TRINITY_DN4157_c0_g1_i3.p1 TRINITY_DN4157_c0_g1~~TRINITY_DN4157_c0_g1_i3.p1  ORF type:complete len:282 (+),score=34.70 TRINITY_DN4157_c0_g1_i3:183-1028(+)